jgi:hypothetical protein
MIHILISDIQHAFDALAAVVIYFVYLFLAWVCGRLA